MWNVSNSCDFPAGPFPVFEERSVQVKYKLAPYFAAHAMEIVENVSHLEATSYNDFSSISSKIKDCE